MVEGQDVESSNSKFGNFLDSIDRLSKKIEDSINGKNDDFNVNDPPIDIVEKPQINESKVKSPNKEEGIIQEKTPELIDFLQRFCAKTSSSF